MNRSREILIAGGGVIGLCCAYYLKQAGHRITLIDNSDMSDGCSYGNAGMIVPSHFTPLAAPGMIAKGVRWMLRPDSPFHIPIKADPALINWSWKFYQASRRSNLKMAMLALRDISLLSKKLFDQIADSGIFQFFFESKGLLMLCRKESSVEEESHHAVTANNLGIHAQVLNRQEVHRMEPRLQPDVLAGVYYRGDAHCCPEQFMKGLKNHLEADGINLVPNTLIKGFSHTGNRVTGVITSSGNLGADDIILCGGTWTGRLARMLGIHLPLQPGKGYSITIDSPNPLIEYPSILCDARVAITPMGDKIRIGGTMEIGVWNTSEDSRRMEGILKSMQMYYSGILLNKVSLGKVWSGLRPCSPDGLPYIGRVGKYNNLVIATGHAMMGLSLGPATGKLVSDLICGRNPPVEIALFSPDRYH